MCESSCTSEVAICLCTHFFLHGCDECLGVWGITEMLGASKIKFYSNFYLFTTNQQEAVKVIAQYLGGTCHLRGIEHVLYSADSCLHNHYIVS